MEWKALVTLDTPWKSQLQFSCAFRTSSIHVQTFTLCSNELKSTAESAPIPFSVTLFLIPAIKTDSLAILLWLQVSTKITHFNKEQFSIVVLYLSLSACFYLLFLLNKLSIWKTFQEQLILITWKQFDWLIKRCFPFRNTWTNLRLILLSKVRMFELEGRICTSLDPGTMLLPDVDENEAVQNRKAEA